MDKARQRSSKGVTDVMIFSSPRGVQVFANDFDLHLFLPTFFIPIRCTAQADRIHTPVTHKGFQRRISFERATCPQ